MSIVSFVSAVATPQARSPRGSMLAAQQQHQCEEKGLSTAVITDGLLTMPFIQPPMVGYTCRASSVAASCPGLVDAGLDSSGEPSDFPRRRCQIRQFVKTAVPLSRLREEGGS